MGGLKIEGLLYLWKLLNRLLWAFVTSVHDVDAVGAGVDDMLLHETAEAAEVGGNTGYAHHGAFR